MIYEVYLLLAWWTPGVVVPVFHRVPEGWVFPAQAYEPHTALTGGLRLIDYQVVECRAVSDHELGRQIVRGWAGAESAETYLTCVRAGGVAS